MVDLPTTQQRFDPLSEHPFTSATSSARRASPTFSSSILPNTSPNPSPIPTPSSSAAPTPANPHPHTTSPPTDRGVTGSSPSGGEGIRKPNISLSMLPPPRTDKTERPVGLRQAFWLSRKGNTSPGLTPGLDEVPRKGRGPWGDA